MVTLSTCFRAIVESIIVSTFLQDFLTYFVFNLLSCLSLCTGRSVLFECLSVPQSVLLAQFDHKYSLTFIFLLSSTFNTKNLVNPLDADIDRGPP